MRLADSLRLILTRPPSENDVVLATERISSMGTLQSGLENLVLREHRDEGGVWGTGVAVTRVETQQKGHINSSSDCETFCIAGHISMTSYTVSRQTSGSDVSTS